MRRFCSGLVLGVVCLLAGCFVGTEGQASPTDDASVTPPRDAPGPETILPPPDATSAEECNGVDDDGDDRVDEGFDTHLRYPDADGDGYGGSASGTSISVAACSPLLPGWSTNALDCNDENSEVFPGAPDMGCDGVDDDCDGLSDESARRRTWYRDLDGDGFGGSAPEMSEPGSESTREESECILEAEDGWSFVGTDCRDADPALDPMAPLISPGADEACDAFDNDCDGEYNEGDVCPGCITRVRAPGVYAFCDRNVDWYEGRDQCRAWGGELLVLDDEEEERWVIDTSRDIDRTSRAWLGLRRDPEDRDRWIRVEGFAATYFNWGEDQPDDYWGEDCAEFFWESDGGWNDDDCPEDRRLVCELD